jgi:hypothetical protein
VLALEPVYRVKPEDDYARIVDLAERVRARTRVAAVVEARIVSDQGAHRSLSDPESFVLLDVHRGLGQLQYDLVLRALKWCALATAVVEVDSFLGTRLRDVRLCRTQR